MHSALQEHDLDAQASSRQQARPGRESQQTKPRTSPPAAAICALVCLVGASLVLSACGRGLDSRRDRLRIGLRGGLVLGFVCWLGAGSIPSLAVLAGAMTLAHLNSALGELNA